MYELLSKDYDLNSLQLTVQNYYSGCDIRYFQHLKLPPL